MFASDVPASLQGGRAQLALEVPSTHLFWDLSHQYSQPRNKGAAFPSLQRGRLWFLVVSSRSSPTALGDHPQPSSPKGRCFSHALSIFWFLLCPPPQHCSSIPGQTPGMPQLLSPSVHSCFPAIVPKLGEKEGCTAWAEGVRTLADRHPSHRMLKSRLEREELLTPCGRCLWRAQPAPGLDLIAS